MEETGPFEVLASRAWRPGSRFDTARVQAILDRLANPERALRAVHVGGTNGKGSVVALVDAALRAAGHRVGRYTSPAVVRHADQVKLDGADVPEKVAQGFLDEILPWADSREDPPTGFELTTALAYHWWARERVDVAVVEVGLGGARDATNVLPDVLAAAVTNVSEDHLGVIGPTLADAAREKAGIAKPGRPFFTAAAGEARDALVAEAARRGAAPVRVLGEDFHAHALQDDPDGLTLGVTGLAREYPEIRLPLAGAHQAANAAIALSALDACDAAGVRAPVDACARGFASVRWPGRLQRWPGRPPLLLDGAHNPAGVHALVQHLRDHDLRPTLVFGCLADKSWMEMVVALSERAAGAVVARPPGPRALDPAESAREFSRQGVSATVVHDPAHALATAIGQAGEEGLVLVTGSLYLVQAILRALGEEA